MAQEKPDGTDFSTWSLDNLVEFARAANERLRYMQDVMDELRADCRTALNAYRDALKKELNDPRSKD